MKAKSHFLNFLRVPVEIKETWINRELDDNASPTADGSMRFNQNESSAADNKDPIQIYGSQ